MDGDLFLALTDMRLLQVGHMLNRLTREHPGHEEISHAAEAIASVRDVIKNLRST